MLSSNTLKTFIYSILFHVPKKNIQNYSIVFVLALVITIAVLIANSDSDIDKLKGNSSESPARSLNSTEFLILMKSFNLPIEGKKIFRIDQHYIYIEMKSKTQKIN